MRSLTDYPEVTSEQETNKSNIVISSEDKIILITNKLRPYLTQLWAKRKRFILYNAIFSVFCVLILFLFVKSYYISTITILPEYGNKSTTLSQLSNLAAMAGVKVGEDTPTEIYQNLIFSETVLRTVIYEKYKTEEFSFPVNLIQYFDIKPDNSYSSKKQERKQFIEAIEEFTKHVLNSDIDNMTKILTVNIKLPESQLSADVANKIAESLDNYVRTQRKSYASEQRFYLEKRLIQIKDSLTRCENKLKNFNEQNRVISQSPALILEQSRLQRNIYVMETVFIEVTKQLELAKIDEIKDTPVLNIKEQAKEPVIKAGPKRLIIFIILTFIFFALSVVYLILEEKIHRCYRIVRG